jgi:hypothetical protein
MGIWYVILGHWLWFVWAVMAVIVIFGYVHVRRRLHHLENAEDVASPEARERHAAKHKMKRQGRVE